MSSKLTSEALTDKGAKRPRAAGATSNCCNNFIKIPHTELCYQLILMQFKLIAKDNSHFFNRTWGEDFLWDLINPHIFSNIQKN